MVVPKIQSVHNSESRNIINKAIEVLNVQGKTIQDLVADGQLTPEQYSQLIREVNGLIAKGEVKLDDLTPEVLEAINNGDGTPLEVLSIPRDGSVTPEKMGATAGLYMYPFHKKATFHSDEETAKKIFYSIKDVSLSNASETNQYYIDELRCAYYSDAYGVYVWAVSVSDKDGVQVCVFKESRPEVTAEFSGIQKIVLPERSESGITGEVLLDWDELGTGFDVYNSDFNKTGLDIRTYKEQDLLSGFLTVENEIWVVG